MKDNKLSVNPWLEIWVRPRETIRSLVRFNSSYLLPLMYWIYGFPVLLFTAQSMGLGDRFSLAMIVIGCLLLAAVFGAVMINLASGLYYWTGKWIGGKGAFQHIRTAIAWSNVPSIANSLIWIIHMFAFGGRIFSRAFVETPVIGGELALMFFTSIAQLIVAIWAFIILLKTLGEVQGFSAWKALLNILLPFFVIFVGAWVLVSAFSLMVGGQH